MAVSSGVGKAGADKPGLPGCPSRARVGGADIGQSTTRPAGGPGAVRRRAGASGPRAAEASEDGRVPLWLAGCHPEGAEQSFTDGAADDRDPVPDGDGLAPLPVEHRPLERADDLIVDPQPDVRAGPPDGSDHALEPLGFSCGFNREEHVTVPASRQGAGARGGVPDGGQRTGLARQSKPGTPPTEQTYCRRKRHPPGS